MLTQAVAARRLRTASVQFRPVPAPETADARPPERDVVWKAPLDGTTNVERFMAAHGIATFDHLLARSIDDPAWFWDGVVQFLGLPFATPYTEVLDTSGGIPWARWFTGGTTNLASICFGFALFASFIGTSTFIEAGHWTGYGFDSSLLVGGLALLPSGVAMLVFSPVAARMIAEGADQLMGERTS